MQTNFIKNLLNLEDVIEKNIKNLKEKVEIYIELPVKEHLCPYCGAETTKIHDYRTQIITDIPVYFKNTKLIYNKRRYECKLCHKSFYQNNSIVNKYSRKSTRLTEFVVDQLRKLSSCSDIANMCGISPGYISRLFPYLAVTPSHLPKVLCIDEFKGNTGHYKYQVALIDGETHEVVDILECRHKHFYVIILKNFLNLNLIMLNILLLIYGKHIKILLLLISEKLKLLQIIFILLDMLVTLLIKLEFLYKIIYQEKKEYTLNTLENFFFQENVI